MRTVRNASRLTAALAVTAMLGVGVTMPGAAAAEPARGACVWDSQELPLPAGTVRGQVNGGDAGWLAGIAGTDVGGEPTQGVLWHQGRLQTPGLAFGRSTYLHAVNPSGVAVGNVTDEDGYYHAIRYRDGEFEYLPESAGGSSSNAMDVNARGEVVGYHSGDQLVVWPPNDAGVIRSLEVPSGETPYGWPAIDDDGSVVAWTGYFDADWEFHQNGYVWAPDGTRTRLAPRLPGDDVDIQDIRDGHIVGMSGPRDGTDVAVEWDRDGNLVHTFHHGTVAQAVNQAGQVVGRATTNGSDEAVVWSDGGAVPDTLKAPEGHSGAWATAINDGEVGGYAIPDTGGSTPTRWLCQ